MLSENLKNIREKQRYTKKQLSQLTGLTAHTIQEIEKGNMNNPRLSTLKALSKALKVSITTLIK